MPTPEIGAAPDTSQNLYAQGEKKDEPTRILNSEKSIGWVAGHKEDNDPIVEHYLTFTTQLPWPTRLPSSDDDNSAPPGPPDLRKYDSAFEWPEARKAYTTWLSCAITVFTAYAAGSYASATKQMSEYWHVDDVAIYVGITMFTTGFATAPMILAPLSEINGRRPVFIATGVLFVFCQLMCAITRSYPGMLLARLGVGIGGSTFSTLVGGVISDMYNSVERNKAMALFAGAALFGTGLGPLVSGFIAQRLTWRWIFYHQVIVDSLLILAVVLFLQETRGSVLLSRKANALNKWYGEREDAGHTGFEISIGDDENQRRRQRIRWIVKSDEERESLGKMIGISLYRPFRLLCTEPVVFFFSLWISFSWAVLYLTFGAIPLVFGSSHDFTLEQSGAVFAAMCVGASISTVLSIYQEKVADHYGKLSTTPEGRLYFACVESVLMPIGLFMFGWTQFSHIHWMVPTIAIGIATMGIYSIYLAVFNYLADVYHRYASSALAAQSFCRNMLGGIFPLLTTAMFNHLTFAGASSFLGGVGALLTIVPWVLVFYGPRIRAKSKLASEIID